MDKRSKAQLRAQYQKARAWQFQTYGLDQVYVDGKNIKQHTGGGAAYGHHALAAFNSAKRHIHFCIALGSMVDGYKRRRKQGSK